MLQSAHAPVHQHQISAERIELVCESVHQAAFPPQSFDFIYSLGMFGHGCPVTVELCNKFHDWLAPGGTLFFNTLDLATLPLLGRMRKLAARRILACLPEQWRERWENREGRLPFCGLTKRNLRAILFASRFNDFIISTQGCDSPLWKGVHLECEAIKSAAKAPEPNLIKAE
jgi:hypothetical protein